MRKGKSILSFVLVLVLVLSMGLSTSVFAEDAKAPTSVLMQLQIESPTMVVNGEKVAIDENGTTPIVKDGRTILPVRAVVEAMSGTVAWDQATKTTTLTVGKDVVKLTIGDTKATLNDKESTLDVAPVIVNERTMLPIRFIMESFGGKVGWNKDSKTITLAYPKIEMPKELAEFVDKELKMVEELGKALSGDWAEKYAQLAAKKLDAKAYMADPMYKELQKSLSDARVKYAAQYVYAVDKAAEDDYVLSIDGSAEPEDAGISYGFEIQFEETYAGQVATARSGWNDNDEGTAFCWSVFAPVKDKAGNVVCIVGIDYPCEILKNFPEFNRDKPEWNGFAD